MADLRELTTDAKRLYEALDYLLEKQDVANTEEIDFKEIWFSAKSRPFIQHVLYNKEELVRRRYLMILSALISLLNDADKKEIQIRFIARILAACEESKIDLKEIITDGQLLNERKIDEFMEIQDEDLRMALLIDMFLLTYLDGQPDEKQMDFAVGYMAMLGLKEEVAKAVGNAVKGILERNDERIVRQNTYLNVNVVRCYMKNPPDGVLVFDIDKAKAVKARKVIFPYIEWKSIPVIKCDEFSAEEIDFISCKFEKSQGVISKNKKLRFIDCEFKDCEVEKYFFTANNTVIDRCTFRDLRTCNAGEGGYLFRLINSRITNTLFSKISIRYTSNNRNGGCLYLYNCHTSNITIHEVESSDFEFAGNKVNQVYGGSFLDNSFLDCVVKGYAYLYCDSNNTNRGNIDVKNCKLEYDSACFYRGSMPSDPSEAWFG